MENVWKNSILKKKLFVNKSVHKINILSVLAPCLAAYRLALIQYWINVINSKKLRSVTKSLFFFLKKTKTILYNKHKQIKFKLK